MMTLDEAIKHCHEKAEEQYKRAFELYDEAVELDKNGLDNCEVRKEGKACFSCHDEHKQLAEWLEELKARREAGRWIPANERLPDEMQRVLIWFEYYRYGDFNCMYQTYGFGYVCDGKWSPFINGETGWQDYNIIAWKPLPEPYTPRPIMPQHDNLKDKLFDEAVEELARKEQTE